jgi:hypothetical protein
MINNIFYQQYFEVVLTFAFRIIRLALAEMKLISRYGCCFTLLKILLPIKVPSWILPNPVRSKPKTPQREKPSIQISVPLLTALFSLFQVLFIVVFIVEA